MPVSTTLLLTDGDIARLVGQIGVDPFMDQLIERLQSAFAEYSRSDFEVPAREGFHYSRGLIEWMPLFRRQDRILLKVVGYHPGNPLQRNLPTIVSSFYLLNATTGQLVAIAEGTLLTALRTGAASGVATQLLADPQSSTLGLVGCGAQAVTQLHAISRVCRLETVRIYDINPAVMASFPERVAEILPEWTTITCSTVEELMEESDIVCTATSVEVGQGPVIPDLPTRPHLHINAVGSDLPGKIEIPLNMLRRSFVCPDFPLQARVEGECQQLAPEHIGPAVTDIAAAREIGRMHQNKLTVFDSTGWALEDLVVLELILQHAEARGAGTRIVMERTPVDPWNPYECVMAPTAMLSQR